MQLILSLVLFMSILSFADFPTKEDSSVVDQSKAAHSENMAKAEAFQTAPAVFPVAEDTTVDTIYVIQNSGIPWNREKFDPERLVRHDTFDPALKVAYTYSVSFIGGSLGSFAQQSFMAHFAYEFTPNLHLYATAGLWMPLYSNIHFGTPIAREDLRQGKVSVLVPDIVLEYKPSDNTSFRVMFINERDAFKAYGPHRFFYDDCPWRNPLYCR